MCPGVDEVSPIIDSWFIFFNLPVLLNSLIWFLHNHIRVFMTHSLFPFFHITFDYYSKDCPCPEVQN